MTPDHCPHCGERVPAPPRRDKHELLITHACDECWERQRQWHRDTNLMREACREALAYLEAPAGSPRLWPVSRGNLARLLERALATHPRAAIITDDEGASE